MPVVGLTGGIASGKSSVLPFFEALGIHWVDMDQVARDVVAPGSQALADIAKHFQAILPDILLPNGELNRAVLRAHIFRHQADKHWLESLLHPLIRQQSEQALKAYPTPYALLVSPLLLEKQLPVDAIVVVDVPTEMQLARAAKRDNNSKDLIQRIIDQQMARDERLAKADFVIDNSGELSATAKQVERLHTALIKRFS